MTVGAVGDQRQFVIRVDNVERSMFLFRHAHHTFSLAGIHACPMTVHGQRHPGYAAGLGNLRPAIPGLRRSREVAISNHQFRSDPQQMQAVPAPRGHDQTPAHPGTTS